MLFFSLVILDCHQESFLCHIVLLGADFSPEASLEALIAFKFYNFLSLVSSVVGGVSWVKLDGV